MAYAAVSKTVEGNLVWVQLPPSALILPLPCILIRTDLSFTHSNEIAA